MIIDQDKEYFEIQKEYETRSIRKWQEKNKIKLNEYVRKNNLMKNYGITPEQYDELFVKQKGCCLICGKHQTEFKNRLSVDHDHITKKIRGLLCYHCNSGLGYFHDNIETLLSAIEYLKREI